MASLILLIGLPGSGKSSLATKMVVERPSRQIVSTDAIRAQLFGNEAVQGPWLKVWAEVQQQWRQSMTEVKETIYDATNAARKQRRQAIALGRSVGFSHIIGLWVNTPLTVCLERNQQRARQVPEAVILRMYRQLFYAPPTLQEGLDCLITLGSIPDRLNYQQTLDALGQYPEKCQLM